MLRDFLQGASSLLFPSGCAACNQPLTEPEEALCAPCRDPLPLLPLASCRSCALPLFGAGVECCETCRLHPPAFDRAVSPFLYEGSAKALVTALKFEGRTSLTGFLSKRMACVVRERLVDLPFQAVLPVPLHPVRLRERTFNQAALLARGVAEELRLPLKEHWIARRRFTRPQTELPREERIRNLRGAFQFEADPVPEAAAVLLVDDVLTTGATAGACARILKEHGIRQVAVVTACRG